MVIIPEAIQALSALKQLPLLFPEQFPRPSCQTLIFKKNDQGVETDTFLTPICLTLISFPKREGKSHLIKIHVVDSNAKSARVHVEAQLGEGLS